LVQIESLEVQFLKAHYLLLIIIYNM